MRTASLTAAAVALLAATPAFATSSIHCRTSNRGPDIWLVVPNERGAGITGARIVQSGEEIDTGQTRGSPWISRSSARRASAEPAGGAAAEGAR